MPQLNLAWWLFNFTLGWISLLILFTILINKNFLPSQITLNTNSSQIPNNLNWLWN